MGKLKKALDAQLKTDHKEDAEQCLKIYDYFIKRQNSIWQSDWNPLVNTIYEGKYPNATSFYKPTEIGRIFLKGLEIK